MADYTQIPGVLNLQGIVGNYLSIPLEFDVDISGYEFEAGIETQDFVPPTPFTIQEGILSDGTLTLFLSEQDTLNIGPCSNLRWYFKWEDLDGNIRTVLTGNFSLMSL